MMPEIVTDGMLVAGDAAGLPVPGIWLEGVNFTIVGAAGGGRRGKSPEATPRGGLAGYRDGSSRTS